MVLWVSMPINRSITSICLFSIPIEVSLLFLFDSYNKLKKIEKQTETFLTYLLLSKENTELMKQYLADTMMKSTNNMKQNI